MSTAERRYDVHVAMTPAVVGMSQVSLELITWRQLLTRASGFFISPIPSI